MSAISARTCFPTAIENGCGSWARRTGPVDVDDGSFVSTRSPAVPFQGYCWLVWLLGTVVLIYKFASQTGYSAVNEAVGVSFTLSLQDLAWLGSLYTYSFAVCTLLGGPLLDYYGARVTLSLALLANAIGALSFAAASTPTGLQIGQVLMGMGGAFGFPGVGYLIRHWFPLRAFGLLFGLTQTVVCIVTAALQSVLGFALASMPWQTLIRCWGYVGMFVALVIVLMIRESPDLRRDAIGPPGGGARAIVSALREVAAIREFWIATLLCAVSFSVLLALAVLWGAR